MESALPESELALPESGGGQYSVRPQNLRGTFKNLQFHRLHWFTKGKNAYTKGKNAYTNGKNAYTNGENAYTKGLGGWAAGR